MLFAILSLLSCSLVFVIVSIKPEIQHYSRTLFSFKIKYENYIPISGKIKRISGKDTAFKIYRKEKRDTNINKSPVDIVSLIHILVVCEFILFSLSCSNKSNIGTKKTFNMTIVQINVDCRGI